MKPNKLHICKKIIGKNYIINGNNNNMTITKQITLSNHQEKLLERIAIALEILAAKA